MPVLTPEMARTGSTSSQEFALATMFTTGSSVRPLRIGSMWPAVLVPGVSCPFYGDA
jgi:hypothetical protein